MAKHYTIWSDIFPGARPLICGNPHFLLISRNAHRGEKITFYVGACWFPVRVSPSSAIPAQSWALLRATAFINNPAEHMLGNHLWLWVLVALRSAWLATCWNAGSVALQQVAGWRASRTVWKTQRTMGPTSVRMEWKREKKLKDGVDGGVNFLSWCIITTLLAVCFLSSLHLRLLWRGQKRLRWLSLFDSSCNTTVGVFGCSSRWLIRPSRSS